MSIEVGDWVMGNTNQDELIHGFIESINRVHGTVGIKVVASDHEAVIGRRINVLSHVVKKLPESSLNNEEQLKDLIDIALLIKDESWFRELSDTLSSIQHHSNVHDENKWMKDANNNRLGTY